MNDRDREKPMAETRYPGIATADDGTGAVVEVETAASEGAGAYPITPSTQMGEGWAAAMAAGKTNVNGKRLLFFEPEGEHAAAAVTAGMSMTGLRAANFSSGQGIAYMHESLYAAAGKRLTYVLNVAARAMTKHALNVHAGHDDYHAVDDTGFFQLFAKDVQSSGDLTLISHRIAELSLTPGLCAQDGFLTSHVIESFRLPERELVKEYLGDPADIIDSPTPAQRLVFGDTRRRIPEIFDVDHPAMLGTVQNQDSYAQGVAAQRPFYFDHVADLTDQAMEEYGALSGREYARVMGYLLEDAEYVVVGQGSVVSNAEAVADWLRKERGLKIGVLDLVMFRPFPADLITSMLRGKKAVTVLERVDQPLAVDPPLLREIRAAMSKGVENARAAATREPGRGRRSRLPMADAPPSEVPHPGLSPVSPDEVPDFYSGGFGFGSRDLQPGDLVAAVDNMLEDGRKTRQYYLGIDFILADTRLPKLQIWQEELLDSYPRLRDQSLPSAGDLNVMPEGAVSIRIHSVGGWGAITMGKNLTLTVFELLGLHVKANPKYGSEKKGQPTTFYATLAPEPIRLNCELQHVNVVLSPDPNVFRNSAPLAGLQEGGVFVIQTDDDPEELWMSFPADARRTIRERGIRVFGLDAFKVATEEASDPELRYRMQGTAFLGAFFAASPLMEREGLDAERLFDGLRGQLQKKFGHLGEHVVDDNLRVIRRGFEELVEIPYGDMPEADPDSEEVAPPVVGEMPSLMDVVDAEPGMTNPGRFWEQVCTTCKVGHDPIADPFAAMSAMPAASSSVRDMTDIRFEVPDFIPELCTGCSQCWVQCPDAAIPGLVNSVEEILATGIRQAANGRPLDRIQQVSKNLAKECHKLLKGVPFTSFDQTLSAAYKNLVEKLKWDAERRSQLDEEFSALYSVLAEFPLAKTVPFFDVPERTEKGSGGLLSITVSPDACKGCNICVDVCPEDALITAKQDDEIVDRLRRNWRLWERLPDTDDRFLNITDLEEGIGVLSSLLLKKKIFRSMVGGDGACMGCGEKTAVHLTVSAIEALMQPRVIAFVEKLDGMIADLETKIRELLASDVELVPEQLAAGEMPDVPLDEEKQQLLQQYGASLAALKDLRWRYVSGPSGRGRANLAITNSTGCSSVWGSTYPYNPYPYPWVNHLFQDAPSIAIGVFEGQMRKMALAFTEVRRAELHLAGEYDPETHEPFFEAFDWNAFTDEEFGLCPPILSIGGDGAMMDIGFQNLSRLLASGKPIRVMVLDTQVYSNTGGQACTSGFTGQVSDMAAYGKAQQGKQETRKELSLIAMAHRGAYVLQTSQATPSHLIEGVLKGLQTSRPAVFNIYTPCPVEHGLADEWAPHAAKLSRAFPHLVYDPDVGSTFAECLDLTGNPAVDEPWETYEIEYVDEEGETRKIELPLTVADWAATEARFKKQFSPLPEDRWTEDAVPFHEFLAASAEERDGKTPYISVLLDDKRLGRMAVSDEIVRLAEDRLLFWGQLKELAAFQPAPAAREVIAEELEAEFETRVAALEAEHQAKMAELRANLPAVMARRLAEGLLRSGNGTLTVQEILTKAQSTPGLEPISLDGAGLGLAASPDGMGMGPVGAPVAAQPAPAAAPPMEGVAAPAAAVAVAVAEEEEEDEGLVLEPYIETALCTTCDECININKRMFAYDGNKQAFIKDPKAGTFREIVMSAEKCTARIIHPGTPLNPKEKDLEKWIKRAEQFN
jgi:pyruvate-ferredoxin/flavodoxin oxidoreductase